MSGSNDDQQGETPLSTSTLFQYRDSLNQVVDVPRRGRGRPRKDEQWQNEQRRSYKKTSISDDVKKEFQRLFTIHGFKRTAKDYALMLPITEDCAKRFMKKMVNGESLINEKKKTGPKVIITRQMSIRIKNMFFINPKFHVKDVVLVLSNPNPSEADVLSDDSYDVTEEKRKAMIEEVDRLRQDSTITPICSSSTVQKHMHSTLMCEHIGKTFSVTRLYPRGKASNSDENKKLRIEVFKEVFRIKQRGTCIVYLDEVHWGFNNYAQKGWGFKNQKIYYHTVSKRLPVTAIATISSNGNGYAEIFGCSVNGAIFLEFFEKCIKEYKKTENDLCFYMDNAPIHIEQLLEIAERYGVKVIFGPPYTPEMNPIEHIFSIWKSRVESSIISWINLENFYQKLEDVWNKLSRNEIRRCIEHTNTITFSKVMDKHDL
ncbi:hypothetical protein WA158_002781 [Blastocystis sp. Blastoise]